MKRLLLLVFVAVASPGFAKRTTAVATVTEPRPISEAEDPVNVLVERTVEDGLLLQLMVDGATMALHGAQPARIPRRTDRNLQGDIVTVIALSGNRPIGSVTVPDQRVNIEEGKGIVLLERRSLAIAVPTAGAADMIEVRVSASGATQRFDVASAYSQTCRTLPQAPVCNGRRGYPLK